MRAWRAHEELVHRVVTLRLDGMGPRAIARALDASRRTVHRILARALGRPRSEPTYTSIDEESRACAPGEPEKS
jgi:DNA invertase Pin-like site-specific DNA recombinase